MLARRETCSQRVVLSGELLASEVVDKRWGQILHTPGNLSEQQACWRGAAGDPDSHTNSAAGERHAASQPGQGTHQTDPGVSPPPRKLSRWRQKGPSGASPRDPYGGAYAGEVDNERRVDQGFPNHV